MLAVACLANSYWRTNMHLSYRGNVSRMFVCFVAMLGAVLMFNQPVRADEPRHEKIDNAKEVLKDAYIDLDRAKDDFGGHKREAMEKIAEASKSLEKWHDNVN